MKKISILGMGRWASCIATILEGPKFKITMWERDTDGGSELFKTRKNNYLTLPESIELTHNLEYAINSADIVIISILSQGLNELCEKIKHIKGFNKKLYCLAMKGVEVGTGRRLSEILLDAGIHRDNIAIWAGPGHAQSLTTGGATNMIISAYNDKLADILSRYFSTKNIRFVTSADIVGTELCSACKNVYGIASGVLQANPTYKNCIGSLMVASVKEMAALIDAYGGKPKTAYGLALLGDYQATLFDDFSKNLTYGKNIVKQNSLEQSKLNKFVDVKTVEGIKTAEAIQTLKKRYNLKVSNSQSLKMPIVDVVNKIVSGKVELTNASELLFKTISSVLAE